MNFPDTTFNLYKSTYGPYRKLDKQTVCINVNLNHPSTTIRGFPKSIDKRLLELLSNKEIFEKQITRHNVALKKVDSKRTWHIHLQLPPVANLIRNKEGAKSNCLIQFNQLQLHKQYIVSNSRHNKSLHPLKITEY